MGQYEPLNSRMLCCSSGDFVAYSLSRARWSLLGAVLSCSIAFARLRSSWVSLFSTCETILALVRHINLPIPGSNLLLEQIRPRICLLRAKPARDCAHIHLGKDEPDHTVEHGGCVSHFQCLSDQEVRRQIVGFAK